MKKFILTLAVTLFGFAAQAQEQPADGAKIQFAEKVINYGKLIKELMELESLSSKMRKSTFSIEYSPCFLWLYYP